MHYSHVFSILQALASTSATPGHTRAFHFFAINQPFASVIPATSVKASPTSVTSIHLSTRGNSSKLASNGQKVHSDGTAGAPADVPITLKFVDVPGLGFAGTYTLKTVLFFCDLLCRHMLHEHVLCAVVSAWSLTLKISNFCVGNTSQNTITSWRGLLERYLHRRDALRVVCHLVDARHGVTDVDREVRVVWL